MSLPKSTTTRRRIALFTGSSMAAASIAAAASFGVMLAPGAAFAANECTPTGTTGPTPATNGTAPDTYACTATPYATGITYDAEGNLTVTKTNTGTTTVTANGVNLTGDGSEALTWDSTIGTVTGGTGTAGPVISVTSTGSGPITVNTAAVTSTAASITYGIYAESTGGGDISVAPRGSISATNSTSGIAAVYAATNGGDITILQDATASSVGTLTGRLYGIRALTSGAGDVTITGIRVGNTQSMATTAGSGIAAIDAAVGAGVLAINIQGLNVQNSNADAGIAIRAAAGTGDIVINKVGGGNVETNSSGASPTPNVLDITLNGGTATINNSSNARNGFGQADGTSAASGRRRHGLLHATGEGSIILNNNSGVLGGQFRLADFNGDFTLNNASGIDGWVTQTDNFFAGGVNTINNLEGAVIGIGRNLLYLTCPTLGGCGTDTVELQRVTMQFSGAQNVINNHGTIVLGEVRNLSNVLGQTLEITGLDTFNHHGRLVMGSFVPSSTHPDYPEGGLPSGTSFYADMILDGQLDDLFVLHDSHWIGHEGSVILLDANLSVGGGAQTSCTRNTPGLAQNAVHERNAGSFAFSDCLDLSGSTVEGRTGIVINDVRGGDRGAYSPEGNVIIDVTGGTADPDAFFVAPGSTGYDPANGGVADKGLFIYTIAYDGDSEQFKIYGIESPSTQQFALLGQAANELWRTATASWYDRQVEMRDLDGHRPTGGAWLRGAMQRGERDVLNTVVLGTTDFDFDNSHVQERMAVTGGRDWVFGDDHTYSTLGVMFGYARNQVSFDNHANTANFEGPHGGIYGGFTSGALYIDGAVNALSVNLDNDIPTFNLAPSGTVMSTDVRSVGAQAEAGWRMAYGAAQFTPLAGVSWTRSSISTMNVPAADPLRLGGEIEFDDVTSLRTSLGARVGFRDLLPGFVPTSFSLTARAVQEHDGEAAVSIVNVGPTALVGDTFDGTFGEVNAALSVGSEGGAATGYLNLGGTFADGYQSLGGSLGFRVAW